MLFRLTEPVLGPVRRLLPPVRAGGIGIDLSFIIVFLGIQFVVIPIVVPAALSGHRAGHRSGASQASSPGRGPGPVQRASMPRGPRG